MQPKRKPFAYAKKTQPILVRGAEPELGCLFKALLSRYPDKEWGTFAWFGWRETPYGLVLTIANLDLPKHGEMDTEVGNVVFHERYTLRMALSAEERELAPGVIHSHPEGCQTIPSWIDDGMDTYLADYFSGFAPGRPYVSLIFAQNESGQVSASGRVFWKGEWHRVSRFTAENRQITLFGYQQPSSRQLLGERALRTRLESAFGTEAAARLEGSTVAIIGASGTGSPVIEALARAGVGNLIVVDPEHFTDSNFERVHGSVRGDIEDVPPKVKIAKRHINAINPNCRVITIQGSLPQKEVVDAVVWADVIVGCTDQEHGRVALSDLSVRYLIPAMDCGVTLEGQGGNITGQIIQMVRFLPSDPCVYCRKMITPRIVSQELMSDEERANRQAAAVLEGNRPANPYWQTLPQINTVGYLTTTAGGMMAGYAIGWITGRFSPPFSRLQINLSAPWLGVTDDPVTPNQNCPCRRMRGMSDQGQVDMFISPPLHWKDAVVVESGPKERGFFGSH